IRDLIVTGVQTCALPICILDPVALDFGGAAPGDLAAAAAILGATPYHADPAAKIRRRERPERLGDLLAVEDVDPFDRRGTGNVEIGRASCRERGESAGVA